MKRDLKTLIKQSEGLIFSEGTLSIESLLSSSYELIIDFQLETEALKRDIEEVFQNQDKEEAEKLIPNSYNHYYSYVFIPEDKQEEASYIFNESVFDFFNEIVPEGYYFSSHEGDGSLFGFWKEEEE